MSATTPDQPDQSDLPDLRLDRVPDEVAALQPFVDAGVFGPAEVHLAATVARAVGGGAVGGGAAGGRDAGGSAGPGGLGDHEVLALAVAARAPRSGHVGVPLGEAHRVVVDERPDPAAAGGGPGAGGGSGGSEPVGAAPPGSLDWPDPDEWAATLSTSPVVADGDTGGVRPLRPLVHDAGRLYLQRLWADEQRVAQQVRERCAAPVDEPSDPAPVLDATFGPVDPDGEVDLQRLAAQRALAQRLTVLVGGPGTGKTRTVARFLAAALLRDGVDRRVALCAPTGKAAARMTEAVHRAVAELAAAEPDAGGPAAGGPAVGGTVSAEVLDVLAGTEATTIHRLLGSGRGVRFRHDRRNPLPHDLVVVDETSMVALPLMARLLDALRSDARLVLVGDPDQLVSVEAGTVLADLVAADDGSGPLAGHVVRLLRGHRFGAGSGIAVAAAAVRDGDADSVLELLSSGRDDLEWVRPDDAAALEAIRSEVVGASVELVRRALDGDAAGSLEAAGAVKVLAATRHGEHGRYGWDDRIEAAVRRAVPGVAAGGEWYVGRPVMITVNDPATGVANGDTGVVLDGVGPSGAGGSPTGPALRRLAIEAGGEPRFVPVSRLGRVDSWWTMTIHKSQGSEFPHVVVSLPDGDSPILTRELLYTAITRAQQRVTVIGSEAAIRRAVGRPVLRASGLRERLGE